MQMAPPGKNARIQRQVAQCAFIKRGRNTGFSCRTSRTSREGTNIAARNGRRRISFGTQRHERPAGLREHSPLLFMVNGELTSVALWLPYPSGLFMKIISRLRSTAALPLLTLLCGIQAAQAGEPITVYTDNSRILSVARPPGTVVVGNPSIADVTIQGNQVFLHARSYGTTNVIIMDENGSMLADYDVTVQTGGDDNVFVFKAGAIKQTFLCAPDCEAILHVGDEKDHFKDLAQQQQLKVNIALGQKSGESNNGQGNDNGPTQ
jgi:hypothetical protein